MVDFEIIGPMENLAASDQQLIHKAVQALDNAYAPYSGFQVAAAVSLHDGTIMTGTNQENAAYPSGMCAERVVLYAWAAQPHSTIDTMVVIARRAGTETLVPATSCGSCRQVMLEFEHRQPQPYRVVMQSPDRGWIVAPSAASLLPFCFSKDDL